MESPKIMILIIDINNSTSLNNLISNNKKIIIGIDRSSCTTLKDIYYAIYNAMLHFNVNFNSIIYFSLHIQNEITISTIP